MRPFVTLVHHRKVVGYASRLALVVRLVHHFECLLTFTELFKADGQIVLCFLCGGAFHLLIPASSLVNFLLDLANQSKVEAGLRLLLTMRIPRSKGEMGFRHRPVFAEQQLPEVEVCLRVMRIIDQHSLVDLDQGGV